MGDGSGRPDAKGKGKARPNGDVLSLDMVEEGYGSNANGPFAQMQLVEQQVRHSSLLTGSLSVTHMFNSSPFMLS